MFGSKFNIGSLMKNAKKIQEMMEKTQDELKTIIVSGESGAGSVKVKANAKSEIIELSIDDDLLKEGSEVVSELVVAACNQALQKAAQVSQEKMLAAGGGLFGGGADDNSTDDKS